MPGLPAAGRHQRADGERIERLVQHDGQEDAPNAGPMEGGPFVEFSRHSGRERQAFDQAVHGHADRGAAPGESRIRQPRGNLRVSVSGMMIVVRRWLVPGVFVARVIAWA